MALFRVIGSNGMFLSPLEEKRSPQGNSASPTVHDVVVLGLSEAVQRNDVYSGTWSL